MAAASNHSPWHGPLRLPNGVRPMVDRIDLGSVLVTIEYDPAISVADFEEAEEWISALIARRRSHRLAAQLGGPAPQSDPGLMEPAARRAGSDSAGPAAAGRAAQERQHVEG